LICIKVISRDRRRLRSAPSGSRPVSVSEARLMRRFGGNLIGSMLACLLALAVLVAVAPEGLADSRQAMSTCGEGVEQPIAGNDHIQAGTAGDLDRNCCTGPQCSAAHGGVLPSAMALPGGARLAPGRSDGDDALYGLAPAPGRHPPRPLA
jgi:hypothetical protein